MTIPPVSRRTLPNGARLIVCESPASETTVLSGLFAAGAAHDPAGHEGLANFTAAVAQRATASRSYEQIYDPLDALGASLSLGASTHAISFRAKCLREHWPDVAEVLTDVLREPSFPDEEFQQARSELLTSLRQHDDSTRAVAERELGHLVYPEAHAYRHPTCGYRATVEGLSREDLAQCHGRLFRPDALILTLVGNVAADEALDRLGSLLEDWDPPEKPLPELHLSAEHPAKAQRHHAEMPEKSQADIALGFKSIPRRHPDYYALGQATQIVGGVGLMGRLGDNVRDRQGLAYYVFARMPEGFGDALWSVRAGVNPANVERAVESILDEVCRIQDEPVPEDELADCQSHLVGVLPVRLETNDGIASALNGIELHGLGTDYIERYPDLIRAVDPAAIQRAAQHHFTVERHSLAIAGPPAAAQ